MALVTARRVNIRFEDWPDVLIIARTVSLAALLEVAEQAVELAAGPMEDAASVRKVLAGSLAVFLDAVESWNLEVEGPDGSPVPVPISMDGVAMLPDPGLLIRAVEVWRDAQMKVKEDTPLHKPSENGRPFLEGSIPMALS